LMKRSKHTAEAVHPMEAPKPSLGSGLPQRRTRYRSVVHDAGTLVAAFGSGANQELYRSEDGGVTWEPTARLKEASLVDGCQAAGSDRSFGFTFDESAQRVVVVSLSQDHAPFPTDLMDAEARVVGASCDARGLAVLLQSKKSAPITLRICPFAQPCQDVSTPDFGERGLGSLVDVARVEGATIVSSAAHGITRVSSSRDNGRTWSPPVLAFDQERVAEEALEMPAPFRLLAVKNRLFVYGGSSRPNEAYWLLISDDQGASFRAP
jgi:hypothetical protein